MCYIQGLHVGTLFRVPTPKKKTFPGMVPVVRRFILWHRISQALVLQQISQSKILGREKPQTVENNSYSLSSQSTGSYNLGLLTLFPCSASAPSPTPTAAPPQPFPTQAAALVFLELLPHPCHMPGAPTQVAELRSFLSLQYALLIASALSSAKLPELRAWSGLREGDVYGCEAGE